MFSSVNFNTIISYFVHLYSQGDLDEAVGLYDAEVNISQQMAISDIYIY